MKRVLLAGAIVVFGLLSLAMAPPDWAPLVLVATISLPHVDGRIDHLAFDQATDHLFVAALGNGTVEVIDTRADRDIRSLSGFREPQGIAVAPEGGPIGVANGEGTGVDLLNEHDFHRVATVALGDDSDDMREKDGRLYVGYGEGDIAAIDPRQAKVIARAAVPGHPEAFSLEHHGTRIFVNVPTAGRIIVIDGRTMRAVANWPVVGARSNFPMALDEANHRLFIGCRDPASVLVYDTASGRQIGSVAAVADTDDLFYDTAQKRLYVSGGEGYLDVFDAKGAGSLARVAHLATAPGARTSLFVPEQHRLYVAVPHRGRQLAALLVFEVH